MCNWMGENIVWTIAAETHKVPEKDTYSIGDKIAIILTNLWREEYD
jgi:hypothetical protein